MMALIFFFISCNSLPKNFSENKKVFPMTKQIALSSKKQSVETQPLKISSYSSSFISHDSVDKNDLNKWIQYFEGKGQLFLERGYKQYLNYEKIILPLLKEYNLPSDLIYVGLIESAYEHSAKSHVSATGPWQFMENTGRDYGLVINDVIDERKNIYKSTLAACKYFVHLYNIFNSWELVLSAYNGGEYGLINKIRQASTRDFKILSKEKFLANETSNYVPKVLAAKIVTERRLQHLRTNALSQVVKKIILNKKFSLEDLSQKYNISLADLRHFNPDIKKNHTNPSGQLLILPSKKVFITQEEIKPIKIVSYEHPQNTLKMIHRVKNGENLEEIAQKYQLKKEEILELNAFANESLVPGQKLIIKYL